VDLPAQHHKQIGNDNQTPPAIDITQLPVEGLGCRPGQSKTSYQPGRAHQFVKLGGYRGVGGENYGAVCMGDKDACTVR